MLRDDLGRCFDTLETLHADVAKSRLATVRALARLKECEAHVHARSAELQEQLDTFERRRTFEIETTITALDTRIQTGEDTPDYSMAAARNYKTERMRDFD